MMHMKCNTKDSPRQCKQFDVFSESLYRSAAVPRATSIRLSSVFRPPPPPLQLECVLSQAINVQHLKYPAFLRRSQTRAPPTRPSKYASSSFLSQISLTLSCITYDHRHSRFGCTPGMRVNPTCNVSRPGPARPYSKRSDVRASSIVPRCKNAPRASGRSSPWNDDTVITHDMTSG